MTLSLALQRPFNGNQNSQLPQVPKLQVIWLLFCASMLAFIANYAVGGRLPALGYILETASCVTCGLSWLLSRELFRRQNDHTHWPYAVVAALFAVSFTLYVSRLLGLPREGLLGFVAQVSTLISSTVLLLPIFEALDGFGKSSATERRFRAFFLTGYTLILGTSLVLAAPAFAEIEHQGQVACCFVALVGTTFAVQYRKHLLAQTNRPTHKQALSDAEIGRLACNLRTLLSEERVYLDPEIKVSDLARRLRSPDYKVTRCITGELGFQNFNQMMNAFRVEEAKRLLADARFDDLSVLTIAMESGFGSIGPFNRAFKLRTGKTPLAFRKASKVAD